MAPILDGVSEGSSWDCQFAWEHVSCAVRLVHSMTFRRCPSKCAGYKMRGGKRWEIFEVQCIPADA